jgi:hypothetical protein
MNREDTPNYPSTIMVLAVLFSVRGQPAPEKKASAQALGEPGRCHINFNLKQESLPPFQ